MTKIILVIRKYWWIPIAGLIGIGYALYETYKEKGYLESKDYFIMLTAYIFIIFLGVFAIRQVNKYKK